MFVFPGERGATPVARVSAYDGDPMPQKWKLSAGGASAQQRADRLRSRSDKLARQATVWETGAEREPSVRRKLSELPPGYTVLHDLVIPDEGRRLDHLVIGNGGLYLVDAKKYSGRLVYSKKMLWHGRFPIVDKLETLVWEAEGLSQILGQEVVPVMCFVDAVLPQPVTTLGSVIVCRVSVLHTVVRSTHATMSVNEVARILEIATELANGARAGADSAVTANPGSPAGWMASAEHDDDFPTAFEPSDDSVTQTSAISTIPPIIAPHTAGGPGREPRARRWPRRLGFALAAIIGVTVTAGIVWQVSQTTEKSAIEAEKNPPSTTAGPTTTPDTVGATTTTVLDLSTPSFSVSCPTPGAGYQLRPVWPGGLEGLAWWDFAFQSFDLSWIQFSVMTAPDVSTYTPTAIPPANTRQIRIRPVFSNGVIGEETIVTWTAPDAPC